MSSSMLPMLLILPIFHILLNLKQSHSQPCSQYYRCYQYSIYFLNWNKVIYSHVPNVTDITEIPYAFQYERNKWTKAISLNYYNSTLWFERKEFFQIPAIYLAISIWFSCFMERRWPITKWRGPAMNSVGHLQTISWWSK